MAKKKNISKNKIGKNGNSKKSSNTKPLIVVIVVFGLVGGFFLSSYFFNSKKSGSRNSDQVPASRQAASDYLANPFKLDNAFILKGKKIYEANCLKCHGQNGKLPRSHPFSIHAGHHTPGDYMWLVTNGILSKGMPAWSDKLSYEERWQVISYIQTTFAGTEPMKMM